MTVDVRLRPWVAADVDALYAAILESAAALRPWMSWCTDPYEKTATAEFLERAVAGRERGSPLEFAVLDPDGNLLGACGLNGIDGANRSANLGYWVRATCAGRGVATAAVDRLQSWSFAHTNLNRLEILVAVGNAGSLRVAEKVGAVREGLLRRRLFVHGVAHDAVLFSLVRPGLARDFSVRLARAEDVAALPEVERLATELYETMPERTGLTPEVASQLLTADEHDAARRAGRLWVAVDTTNRPIGFAHVREIDGVPHLEELDVVPEHGRRGVGSALLDAVLASARATGPGAVTLSTFRDVPWNAPFYRRRGFRDVPADALGGGLAELVESERRSGLVVARRVVMRWDAEPEASAPGG